MAAVISVTASRVRDGKLGEILALYGRLKKVVERLGAKARVVQQTAGATPGALSFIIETDGWVAYGAFIEKLESDAEYQAVLAEARANPRSDIIQRTIATELDV